MSEHTGKASSFADPKDVSAFNYWFKLYKAQGMSEDAAELKAFAHGDNGIGVWGDITSEGSGPSCALTPEDMEEAGALAANKWRSVRGRAIQVTAHGNTITCILKDRLPHRKLVKHGVVIDLNPDAIRLLGYEPPTLFDVSWSWIG